MAVFTNFATLSYNGGTVSSNTVTGEILECISAEKTAVTTQYAAGSTLSYAVSLVNTGPAPVTGLTVTDDLGAYEFDGQTLYPLACRADSLRLFVNGVLQPSPTVTAGPPLTVSGLTLPAGGDAVLVYETEVTAYAPLAPESVITNTASVSGGGLSVPLEVSATVDSLDGAALRISKAVSPAAVPAGGELCYSFEITNTGNTAAADDVVLTDTFDPVLTNIAVSLNGQTWARGVNFSYEEASGLFSTLPGQLTVPAAVYTRNADGTWAVEPGRVTLTVSGNIKTQS